MIGRFLNPAAPRRRRRRARAQSNCRALAMNQSWIVACEPSSAAGLARIFRHAGRGMHDDVALVLVVGTTICLALLPFAMPGGPALVCLLTGTSSFTPSGGFDEKGNASLPVCLPPGYRVDAGSHRQMRSKAQKTYERTKWQYWWSTVSNRTERGINQRERRLLRTNDR
jgi:hypothetical protein